MVIRAVVGTLLVTLTAGAAAQTRVDDRYPFQPGDIISLGPNSYPVGATYRIAHCDPVDKPYRECRIIRRDPDDGVERPMVMENQRDITLVGRAAPPAAAPARPVAAPQPQRPAVAAAAPPARAAPSPGAARTCPRVPFGGRVAGNIPASPALFRQKIMDSITGGSFGNGWYGVTLDNFRVGAPIINRVSNQPGVGAVRVNTGAPVNAVMYPVSTTMAVCEGTPTWSGSFRTSNKKYLCFVSKDNEWTCGASS